MDIFLKGIASLKHFKYINPNKKESQIQFFFSVWPYQKPKSVSFGHLLNTKTYFISWGYSLCNVQPTEDITPVAHTWFLTPKRHRFGRCLYVTS